LTYRTPGEVIPDGPEPPPPPPRPWPGPEKWADPFWLRIYERALAGTALDKTYRIEIPAVDIMAGATVASLIADRAEAIADESWRRWWVAKASFPPALERAEDQLQRVLGLTAADIYQVVEEHACKEGGYMLTAQAIVALILTRAFGEPSG
jgi:hypothetical protein